LKGTVFLLAFAVITTAVRPDSVVFQPDDALANDSYVNSKYPTGNWGDYEATYAGYLGGGILRSFIQFVELTAYVGGDYEVNSATLTLYCQSLFGQPAVRVDPCDAVFSESSVTWSNQPGIVTGYTEAFDFPIPQDYVNVDVTDIVADWVTAELPHFGFSVRLQDETAESEGALLSGEYDYSTYRPKLTMEYTDTSTVAPASLGYVKAVYR
jgi:hypothetical protein